jgi:hypothetical protein
LQAFREHAVEEDVSSLWPSSISGYGKWGAARVIADQVDDALPVASFDRRRDVENGLAEATPGTRRMPETTEVGRADSAAHRPSLPAARR